MACAVAGPDGSPRAGAWPPTGANLPGAHFTDWPARRQQPFHDVGKRR